MATERFAVVAVAAGVGVARHDQLAREEPLWIDVSVGDQPAAAAPEEPLAVILRTPPGEDPSPDADSDVELAAGYLVSEGVLRGRSDLHRWHKSGPNQVRLTLARESAAGRDPGWRARLERRGYVNSACGLCGRAALDPLEAAPLSPVEPFVPTLPWSLVGELPSRLRDAQPGFQKTGGLHAAGLFDAEGARLCVREDAGRHSALDKVIGAELLAGRLPLTGRVLVLSGRAGVELVQKARMVGIPLIIAVGAPTSLAVRLARAAGITLIGFARPDRFNIYSAPERIHLATR